MRFTAWQLDKLRRGLGSYRAMKAVNTRLLPWKAVLDALLVSPVTSHEYSLYGNEPEFKEEALRRFGEGKSVPDSVKLNDVRLFLVSVGVLKDDELQDGADVIAEATTIHDRLAATGADACDRLALLASRYRGDRKGGTASEAFELRVIAKPLASLLLVEEHSTRTIPESKFQAGHVASSSVRRGYAFATTQDSVLNVFLRGADHEDFIQYTEVFPFGKKRRAEEIRVIRSGGKDVGATSHGEAIPRMFHNAGIIEMERQREHEGAADAGSAGATSPTETEVAP